MIKDDYRRVTDESQTTTDESQTTTDKSQITKDGFQTNAVEPLTITGTRVTEVYFQLLTWFNKFICRPSNICYYAI